MNEKYCLNFDRDIFTNEQNAEIDKHYCSKHFDELEAYIRQLGYNPVWINGALHLYDE